MRLDQELMSRGLCESRTEAQELIASGAVSISGITCLKQTKQVVGTDEIMVHSRRRFVSRGGEKLEGVLLDVYGNQGKIKEAITGKNALDVGSSTGGFTDFLIQNGIAHVDAVDVGTAQLHDKIRNDSKVSVFENMDIRKFTTENSYGIVVADLSFISLTQIFEDIVQFGTSDTSFFLLIKPQFEVGKGNTKKGIVKDMTLVETIREQYRKLAITRGLKNVQVYESHIQGGDGNQEYFLYGVL
jgi:23S rRNA (cytidine1920-2'-O)/16S rRNA (cytidine1409-2'-O)-methyltransferase